MDKQGSARGFSDGVRLVREGLQLIRRRDILPWVIAPITLNTVVYIAMIWFALSRVEPLIAELVSMLPQWLAFLEWFAWTAAVLLVLVIIAYTFTFVANLIGSPLNSLLAEKVLIAEGGTPVSGSGAMSLLASIPVSLAREGAKLLYLLPRLIVVLIVSFIPPFNLISPVIWFVFGAWSLSLEYTDYGAEATGHKFASVRVRSKKNRSAWMGLGAMGMVVTMVPILNLVAMPAMVCAGTMLWARAPRSHDS